MYGKRRFYRKTRMSPTKRAFLAGVKAGKRQAYRKKKTARRWY